MYNYNNCSVPEKISLLQDLVYIISPLPIQLHTALCKATIKYVGPVVIYKTIDPHNYLLMTLDSKILRGLFDMRD